MDREPLHNAIIREIIAGVASGAYRKGRRLPAERILCRQFDVARGTVRKALAVLQDMGVVEVRPNSGAYVLGIPQASLPRTVLPADFDSVDVADVIDARLAIESAALDLAMRRVNGVQLRRLRQLVDRMAEAVMDLPRFLELDMAFHQAIVEASGNRVLVTAFEAIYEYHRFSQVFTSRQQGEEHKALEYHRKLLANLERRNARQGKRVLNEHLSMMKKYGRNKRGKAARAMPPTP